MVQQRAIDAVGLREIYIALARFIIASALLYCRGTAFRVKLGANDLNCVDVQLNPHSLILSYSPIDASIDKVACATQSMHAG